MTDFVLVRHGETPWHAENRYAGRTDVPLTERGRRQAAALGVWAGDQRLDAVLSSPLRRARLTAEPAAAALGLPVRVDERLCEVDFGRGEGLTRAEMRERFPRELAAFLADPVTHHLPGGEDPAAAAARARDCLARTAARFPGGRVLVVAHSTLVRLLLCDLLGIPLARYRTVFPALENGALTELRLHDGTAALLRLNAPAQVPSLLATTD
ncbi:histidine phosphatase family protein [Streptomyces cinereospinus]|uniref:Histidine phosphatase family protein n=1 Tax=Streptomyces cinereospinus TaxID=285561 RepID=A0ABV5N5I7_9ACTN